MKSHTYIKEEARGVRAQILALIVVWFTFRFSHILLDQDLKRRLPAHFYLPSQHEGCSLTRAILLRPL